MKIKIDEAIKTLEGKPIKEGKEAITVKDILLQACTAHLQEDAQMQGTEKFKLYNLAQKINGQKKDIELTVEEVSLLKDRVGKAFNVLVVGQVWTALENN
jgi:hypothetical protein